MGPAKDKHGVRESFATVNIFIREELPFPDKGILIKTIQNPYMRYRYYYEKQSRMCQETPLHMAARSGNVQVAQLLVSHGAEVERPQFGWSHAFGHRRARRETGRAWPGEVSKTDNILYLYKLIFIYIFTLYIYMGAARFRAPGTVHSDSLNLLEGCQLLLL